MSSQTPGMLVRLFRNLTSLSFLQCRKQGKYNLCGENSIPDKQLSTTNSLLILLLILLWNCEDARFGSNFSAVWWVTKTGGCNQKKMTLGEFLTIRNLMDWPICINIAWKRQIISWLHQSTRERFLSGTQKRGFCQHFWTKHWAMMEPTFRGNVVQVVIAWRRRKHSLDSLT